MTVPAPGCRVGRRLRRSWHRCFNAGVPQGRPHRIRVILRVCRDNGKKMEITTMYWGYIGVVYLCKTRHLVSSTDVPGQNFYSYSREKKLPLSIAYCQVGAAILMML